MEDKKNLAKLLVQRNTLKKPAFIVKESSFKPSIKARWRRPTGKHSPVRQYHKGRVKMPHPGYGAPSQVKGLLKDGSKPVLVNNIKDLNTINSSRDMVVIGSNVGLRKRLILLKKCLEKKLKVNSIYHAEDLTEKISIYEKMLAARKKKKLENIKVKQNKKKDVKKDVTNDENDDKNDNVGKLEKSENLNSKEMKFLKTAKKVSEDENLVKSKESSNTENKVEGDTEATAQLPPIKEPPIK